MFTGIITDVGTVEAVEPDGEIVRLAIASHYDPETIAIGASIACAGVCLTVVACEPAPPASRFVVEAGPETLRLTTIQEWQPGRRINLERALRLGDELGGHLVAGHVDGIASIFAREDIGETVEFGFAAPRQLARFIAAKGSVALDGTSLTVNRVEGARFTCLLIPHTLKVTSWGERRPGDAVNIEVDTMARYAARLTEVAAERPRATP